MNLLQLFLILKARVKVIVITVAIALGLAIALNLLLPKTYRASTTLVVNYKGVDTLTGLSLAPTLMTGFMNTQIDIINSHAVAKRVVESLNLAESPKIKEDYTKSGNEATDINDWLADVMLRKMDAKPSRESSIIEISYSSVDPHFSAILANAFAAAYQEASLKLKVEPSKRTSTYLSSQSKMLLANLESAQAKLSKYQQENGLTSVAENLDVENAKLNQLAAQLVMVESQASENASRNTTTQSQGESAPDIISSPLVQNLKLQLAQTGSKLSEAEQRYGKNHPQYLAIESDMERLSIQLQSEIHKLSNSVSGSAKIYKQSETQLRSALNAQKQKVLELNRKRDQVTVLQREVESADSAYNSVTQRMSQTNIEGGANETDISVLTPAIPPSDPSSPKYMINILIALFLGSGFGVCIALVREILDRKIRCVDDIVTLTEMPVLAIVSK